MVFNYRKVRSIIGNLLQYVWRASLGAARREQGLSVLCRKLEGIVPTLADQYSDFKIESPYLTTKVRSVHAFQISLIQKVLSEFDHPTIVDIGDSSGTHIKYLFGLYGSTKPLNCLSVNLDLKAVERITQKGLRAIHARAEDLSAYNIAADIFLCFETFEHLMNPSQFLHELSSKTTARYLIITVPYVRQSRVGLHHIRNNRTDPVSAEVTHIFELCPQDIKLLALHSGWRPVFDRVYRQYPRFHPLRITQPLWRRFDFEGFYGIIFERSDMWSRRYLDW